MKNKKIWLRIIGISAIFSGIIVITQIYCLSPAYLPPIKLIIRLLAGIVPLTIGVMILAWVDNKEKP